MTSCIFVCWSAGLNSLQMIHLDVMIILSALYDAQTSSCVWEALPKLTCSVRSMGMLCCRGAVGWPVWFVLWCKVSCAVA